jgi:hypothetical protein
MKPHDKHDNSAYLTIEDLERSAKADRMTLETAVQNLIKTVAVAEKETEHQHR